MGVIGLLKTILTPKKVAKAVMQTSIFFLNGNTLIQAKPKKMGGDSFKVIKLNKTSK